MIRLVLDPGSTHMGKLDYALELIEWAGKVKAWGIKFQLFGDKHAINGNVKMPYELWWEKLQSKAVQSGVKLFGSCFNNDAFEFLVDKQVPAIKLAYSMKDNQDWVEDCLDRDIEPIVSCDVMSDREVNPLATKLYCVSEYPVKYQIDFEGLFPRFHGFSSHTLGYMQDELAVVMGAKMIEKHITLPYANVTCPDSRFAIQCGVQLEEYASKVLRGSVQ